jgi:hypothetical protein
MTSTTTTTTTTTPQTLLLLWTEKTNAIRLHQALVLERKRVWQVHSDYKSAHAHVEWWRKWIRHRCILHVSSKRIWDKEMCEMLLNEYLLSILQESKSQELHFVEGLLRLEQETFQQQTAWENWTLHGWTGSIDSKDMNLVSELDGKSLMMINCSPWFSALQSSASASASASASQSSKLVVSLNLSFIRIIQGRTSGWILCETESPSSVPSQELIQEARRQHAKT